MKYASYSANNLAVHLLIEIFYSFWDYSFGTLNTTVFFSFLFYQKQEIVMINNDHVG